MVRSKSPFPTTWDVVGIHYQPPSTGFRWSRISNLKKNIQQIHRFVVLDEWCTIFAAAFWRAWRVPGACFSCRLDIHHCTAATGSCRCWCQKIVAEGMLFLKKIAVIMWVGSDFEKFFWKNESKSWWKKIHTFSKSVWFVLWPRLGLFETLLCPFGRWETQPTISPRSVWATAASLAAFEIH